MSLRYDLFGKPVTPCDLVRYAKSKDVWDIEVTPIIGHRSHESKNMFNSIGYVCDIRITAKDKSVTLPMQCGVYYMSIKEDLANFDEQKIKSNCAKKGLEHSLRVAESFMKGGFNVTIEGQSVGEVKKILS